MHSVHDTQPRRLRHLNFFQHDFHTEVRVPRIRLPDGKAALVEPEWFGQLAGFTLLFEALSPAQEKSSRVRSRIAVSLALAFRMRPPSVANTSSNTSRCVATAQAIVTCAVVARIMRRPRCLCSRKQPSRVLRCGRD